MTISFPRFPMGMAAMASVALAALMASSEPVVDTSRVFEDFPFDGASAGFSGGSPSALKISFKLDFPSSPRAVSVHLKAGEGWHSAEVTKYNPDLSGPVSLRVPLSDFSPEDSPDPIGTATNIRVSVWMERPAPGRIVVTEAGFAGFAKVAVACATEATAPGETAFAKSMADRASSLLSAAGIDGDTVGDDFRPSSLKPYETVLLPYSPSLSATALANLKLFLGRGGKLVVFFNGSGELAKAMGMGAGSWRKELYPMTSIELTKTFGSGRRFPYYAEGFIPPSAPLGSSARIVAWLVGADGERTAYPAIAVSGHGAWFAHVPPRAYPAAADALAAIVTGDKARARRRQRPLSALPKGKTVAAWLSSPYPRFKGGWNEAARQYRSRGINAIFLYVQAGDTMLEATGAGGTDNVAAAIRACHENGIAIHAWVACFSLDGMPPARKKAMAAAGRILKDNGGWLDPRVPANRADIAASLARLARMGFDGIHLDYVRTPDFGFPRAEEYFSAITEFVRQSAAAVRAERPKAQLSAAVYATPKAAARKNQDWPQWLKNGLLDFVSPMIYTSSPSAFKSMLDDCLAEAAGEKLLPGIGTGSDESQAGTDAADAEIRFCDGCRGVAFFALEDALMELLGN